ncbi:uncharacterized protein LOC143846434 isoform X2 [Tasmannia lanceolata]|uniref:uncharacterized protein LOC143846434 isoform X2 n=1 Tax=Tasmannia lanceolata TaxID=3420 RepID=UPI00406423E4
MAGILSIGAFKALSMTPHQSLKNPSLSPASTIRVFSTKKGNERLGFPIVGRRNGVGKIGAIEDERGPGPKVETVGYTAVVEAEVGVEPSEIDKLKRALIDSSYGTDRGLKASSETTAEIVELITKLEAKNPTPAPTEALILLNGKWILVYTSLSALFPLLGTNVPLVNVEEISQSIDLENLTMQNSVRFSGPLATTSLSTNAKFEVCSPQRVQVNAPRIFQIERDIISSTQDQLSVEAYYTRIKALWDELAKLQPFPKCTCGALKALIDYQQQHRLIQFFMGLNESFAAVRGQILVMDPLPSVNLAFSLILQEERQRDVAAAGQQNMETTALAAKHVRNSEDRNNRQNNKKNSKVSRRPTCDHCGLEGHTIGKCYQLNGYPPAHRIYKRNPQPAANQTMQQKVNNEKFNVENVPANFPFTSDQCQQLLSLITKPQPMAHHVGSIQPTATLSVVSHTGPYLEENDWSG